MNEAVQKILKYIDDNLFEPDWTWPKHIFEERSYSRWAAYEIIRRIMDHPFESPDIVVEAFMMEMSAYSYLEKSHNIFSIARDTAEDILYLF